MKKYFISFLTILSLFLLVGCVVSQTPEIKIESLTLTASKQRLAVKESLILDLDINPNHANGLAKTFTSDNHEILRVDTSGKVTGVSIGTTTIRVKIQDKEASLEFEVYETTLDITERIDKLEKGETHQLIASLPVIWGSSNENIATISEDGLITAIKKGNVVISASYVEDGNSVKIEMDIEITETIKEPKVAPISTVYEGMLPSLGAPRIVVLMIEFPDAKFDTRDTKESVEQIFFGNNSAYHTVKSFYLESSYGNLELDGEVLPIYTAKRKSTDYVKDYDDYASDAIIKEAIQYFDKSTDFSYFDENLDTYIDNVVTIYSKNYYYDSNVWWAYNTNYYDAVTDIPLLKVDRVNVNNYVWASIEFLYEYGANGNNINTFIHELGHSFGLDDYYDYDDSKGPKGGLGGADLMDHTEGDHNPFSKYLLGWVDPVVVDISKSTNKVYTLNSFVDSGDFILVINGNKDLVFSEYMIIEYYTANSLNSDSSYLTTSGVRIFHVNAQLGGNTGDYQTAFRYDNSDEVKKLLRMIEADGRNDIETGRTEELRIASNNDLFKNNSRYQLDIKLGTYANFNISNNQVQVTFS